VNYYEHHLGDWIRDTAHLSMLEDGAYRRLVDAYYTRGKPLPLVARDVYRLVRATCKQDREAVDTVLEEFFVQAADGWRHSRCDREIARFQDKQDKARNSANARWNNQHPHSERNANALPTQCEGNAPNLQTPDSRHQEDKKEEVGSADVARVFDHWRTVHGKSRSKLDDKRKKLIRAALKNYSADLLCQSIDGYKRSTWHQGKNDRGTVFDDIELMLRDAKQIDAGLKHIETGTQIQW
jgi:uncharacterized protein YdaU (DUF1376 family)